MVHDHDAVRDRVRVTGAYLTRNATVQLRCRFMSQRPTGEQVAHMVQTLERVQ